MKQITRYGFYDVDLFECPSFQMFTVNDCPRASDILFHKHFEPMSMRLWCRLARTATGILDIGAQVGVYSLAAAALRKDIPIHAIEPNPYAYARLRVHKQLNHFDNIVEFPCAASDTNGYAMLSWVKKPGAPISSGARLGVLDLPVSQFETVPAIIARLDSLNINLGSDGLIKIDVEGGEEEVFTGMGSMIESQPDIILESFSARACKAIWAGLRPLGYRAYIIDEGGKAVVEQVGLHARNVEADDNFNQFLTVRPHEDIIQLLKEPA